MNEDRLNALHRMTTRGFPITIFDQVNLWKAGQQQQLEKQRSQSQGANAPSEEEKGINRMGLGLPLSTTYARYFGGSLDLMSLDGWGESHAVRFPITRFMDAIELFYCLLVLTHYLVPGVDVYLRLPRLGTNLENIEI
jgi:pyruvate dehydrogenase kinase 2/3/4